MPSEPLDGQGRLALLHGQMHPGSREPFRFSWRDIPKTGLGTKDYIAPDSFDFRQSRLFRVGQYWGAASYLQIMASELSDKLLAEILELDAELTVTMHIQTVDQLKAIKTVKGKLSDIGKMKVEEQRKAVRSGYDPDILPPDLITFPRTPPSCWPTCNPGMSGCFADVHGGQLRPHPAKVGERHLHGERDRAEIQLRSQTAGLAAGTGLCVLPGAGA